MKKVFSVVFAAVFALCIYSLYSPAQASAASIGDVNIREVLASYPDMRTTNAAIDLERQKAQQDFNEKAKSLDDKAKRELFNKMNQQMAQRQDELIKPIREKLQKAIEAVAKEKGLEVILDSSVVVYGGEDVTKAVMAKLQAM
ncbi:OmpH family outer membrane protein [Pectinatus brassicae]|uniref:Outer membrane protein n=1 Tax=Pectinatus brassicae TaxID=862415 RepID=A0A840UG93_9FIRM|nr:OmpH family outer membrane protein [Pectinatus brassicae]MBB5336136.1 outer membrane protein [Pectinatus brassicae]